MKKQILLVPILISTFCFSQSTEEVIANEICINMSKLDLEKKPELLNQEAMQVYKKVYSENQSGIISLLKLYEKSNEGKNNAQLSILIGQEITVHLMDKCESYQRITMFQSKPVPVISETTKLIGLDFTRSLESKAKKKKITQKMIDECILEITDKHANLVTQKYGDRYAPKFISEFQAYLMTESMPYIKWMASKVN